MKGFNIMMPKAVYSGIGAMEQIKTVLDSDIKKAAIFTDKGIMGAGLLEYPLSYIKEMGVDFEILDELPPEPDCDEAQIIIDQFKQTGADFIVAVGGGSVMDIAKLASILATDDYEVRDLLENPLLGKKGVKSLMIPTTAGTGSEATPNSIVAVPEKELKVGIVNPAMIADAVILDAAMIAKLPKAIAASTGVDALAHAIECFTSKKANPFSDTFALDALDLIMNNIERACETAGEGVESEEILKAKNAMLVAAFYAGAAITASGTTAVHALSYPLGGKYHIPHGVANAMMLIPVMKFNEPMCRTRFAKAYDRIVKDVKEQRSEEEKSAFMIQRMDEIVRNLEIPASLSSYGVSKDDLEILVTSGMEVTRLLVNNLREVTPEDARALYLEIM